MARKALQFVSAATPSGLIPLDQIPAEVQKEAEEIYAHLRENEGRMSATFDTVEEARMYARQLASYCAQRPAKFGKPLKFRASPTRNKPDTQVDFRITHDVEASGKANAQSGNSK